MSSPSTPGLLAQANRAVSYLRRVPGIVFSSLNPKTETEAQIVNAQLDLLRTSLKFFDYLLPVAGGVVFVFDRWHESLLLGLWWAALTLNCFVNEVLLSRPVVAENTIAQARKRSRQQVVDRKSTRLNSSH